MLLICPMVSDDRVGLMVELDAFLRQLERERLLELLAERKVVSVLGTVVEQKDQASDDGKRDDSRTPRSSGCCSR